MVKEYDGKVRVVYKHFVVHPEVAMAAHLAACAAGKQGKFSEFTAAFWKDGFNKYRETRDPSAMGKDSALKIAKGLGLDMGKLEQDMGAPCQERIAADMKELNNFGVNGTPSFYVNGKFSMFAGPGAFKQLIDRELAIVEGSGAAPGEYYQKVVVEAGEKKFKPAAPGAGHGPGDGHGH